MSNLKQFGARANCAGFALGLTIFSLPAGNITGPGGKTINPGDYLFAHEVPVSNPSTGLFVVQTHDGYSVIDPAAAPIPDNALSLFEVTRVQFTI